MIIHRDTLKWAFVLVSLVAAGSALFAQPEPASNVRETDGSANSYDGNSIQDTLRGGLIVKAINRYCPTRKWDECLAGYYQLRVMNPVKGVFLTDNRRTAESNVVDIHVRILDELKKRMLRGALGQVDWGLGYLLTLNVLAVDFQYDQGVPGKVMKPSVQIQTSLFLESTSSGETIFRQTPPLLVSRTREPGDPAIEMGDLVRKTVSSVYDTLKTLSANLEKTD